MNKQHEEIAQMLADNICYSPQVQGVVIHGVIEKLAAREKEAQLRAINSLYQSFLPMGYRFSGDMKVIFHDHYNLVSGGQELPEPAQAFQNSKYLKGLLTGLLIAFFISALLTFSYFREQTRATPPTLPVEQQLNDTLQINQGNLSSDSSYLDYRQGSPKANKVYDSSVRAERREGK